MALAYEEAYHVAYWAAIAEGAISERQARKAARKAVNAYMAGRTTVYSCGAHTGQLASTARGEIDNAETRLPGSLGEQIISRKEEEDKREEEWRGGTSLTARIARGEIPTVPGAKIAKKIETTLRQGKQFQTPLGAARGISQDNPTLVSYFAEIREAVEFLEEHPERAHVDMPKYAGRIRVSRP